MLGQGAATLATANYNDIAGLAQIRQLAQVNEGQAYEEVSRQFESLLVHAMLKGMRNANRVWSEGGLLRSHNVEFYEGMLDEQLSLALVQGEGLGLADQFAEQTRRAYAAGRSDASEEPASAPIPRVDTAALRRGAASLPRSTFAEPPAIAARADAASAVTRESALANSELDRDNFIESLWPLAEQAAGELGVPAHLLLAQAALETGWGEQLIRHPHGDSSHNLFGIKAQAGWQGDTATVTTHEYIGGRRVNVRAAFRSYASFAESFADYVGFVSSNPRYAGALAPGADRLRYPERLQQAGYATDPDYASKIHDIARRIVAQRASAQPFAQSLVQPASQPPAKLALAETSPAGSGGELP